MASKKIEEYALIGDCESAALVACDGSIDWLCWPNFSSPACFAALLGTSEHGYWKLAPAAHGAKITRRYIPHTLTLETTFKTATGTIILTDLMPVRGKNSDIIRKAICTEGEVRLLMELVLRFDFGSSVPWITQQAESDGIVATVAKSGPDLAVLRADVDVEERSPGSLHAQFLLQVGEGKTFVLTYGCSYEPVPHAIDVDKSVQLTQEFWTDWAGKSRYVGPYSEAVERSLITLKAMTYRPSGGIVAAPTTSLPERVGGSLNWDYRYCWIRDATLTLSALLEAGYTEEVVAWKRWLLRAVGQDASQVQIMYGISGERHIADWEIAWLPGYEGSSPVRVGNKAQKQTQQDIYGEIAAALFHAREAGIPCEPQELLLQQRLTEHLASIWQEPGSGMWEERNEPQRFTYSGVMAWLALDRAVKSIEQHGMDGPLEEWKKLRETVRNEVEQHGFHTHSNTFVQHFGSKDLDASLLLIPIVDFVPADDPRVLGTVKVIEEKLMKGGLLLRNIPSSPKGQQGAFLACTFWLVEVYAMIGRADEARALFERLLALSNEVGLLSEEYDTEEGRLVGNFPQAFSHIALVRAAMRLAGCP